MDELYLNSWDIKGVRITSRLYDTTVGCMNEGDDFQKIATDAFFLEPFDEDEPAMGYFIQAIFNEEREMPEGARYLSSDKEEVKGLVSLETLEEMQYYAEVTNDMSAAW